MNKCPYCQGYVTEPLPRFNLSEKRRRIFDDIVAGGPDGVSTIGLLDRYFPEREWTTLRTTIFAINEAIKPLRIVSSGGRYRIERNGE